MVAQYMSKYKQIEEIVHLHPAFRFLQKYVLSWPSGQKSIILNPAQVVDTMQVKRAGANILKLKY